MRECQPSGIIGLAARPGLALCEWIGRLARYQVDQSGAADVFGPLGQNVFVLVQVEDV